jgi:hypothetical protein
LIRHFAHGATGQMIGTMDLFRQARGEEPNLLACDVCTVVG